MSLGLDAVAADVAALEASAQARFVRWDDALWREVLAGPAARLAAAGVTTDLLRAYLRLASEGIGLGYLFPASAGTENFFTVAWLRLIPQLLPRQPAARQADTLASCWNLGENLEGSPPWLRRIFQRVGRGLTTLDDLERLVAEVSRQALEPPERRLGEDARAVWIPLFEEDRRFLPGGVHFVAPTVVCVHDRQRTPAAGREDPTMGVWLADPPLVLGPMSCAEDPRDRAGWIDDERWRRVARADPRFDEAHAAAGNEWRGAATLKTSQFLVALLPPAG